MKHSEHSQNPKPNLIVCFSVPCPHSVASLFHMSSSSTIGVFIHSCHFPLFSITVCILPFLSQFVPVLCMAAWLLQPFTLSCVVSLIDWCSVTRLAKKRITLPQWQVETNSLGQEHTSTAQVQLVSGIGKKKPLFCMMESSNICFMSLHLSCLWFV